MVARAEGVLEGTRGEVRRGDLEDLDLTPASVDLVVSRLALTSWLVDDYFLPGPRERSWMGSTVTWHHRSTEQHLQHLREAGFVLEALSECPPPGPIGLR